MEIFSSEEIGDLDTNQSMDREDIKRYLEVLNIELKNRNVQGEISIVGGAVMCLCYEARISTTDIDAIFEPKMIIYECAKVVARNHNLSDDWLNDGVKGFLSSKGDFFEYAEMSNLKIYVASPEYMLAMKCLSARLESFNEFEDIKFLLGYLKISTFEEAFAILKKFYPVDRYKVKIEYALREILESYG